MLCVAGKTLGASLGEGLGEGLEEGGGVVGVATTKGSGVLLGNGDDVGATGVAVTPENREKSPKFFRIGNSSPLESIMNG